ncbi:MAG: GNAT family N-acetyltransferase [Bacteriovoracaceae bacterium]|nr:GNAT family N-acetyltransferase [Bacteriovoracaceae bacterium]
MTYFDVELYGIYILPDYQDRGLGRKLIQQQN